MNVDALDTIRCGRVSGIYRITCVATGKGYVGQAVSLRARASRHIRELKALAHSNRGLSEVVNRHGIESLTFSILEVCDSSALNHREEYHIRAEGTTHPDGYNFMPFKTD